jgi:hypothetical protein
MGSWDAPGAGWRDSKLQVLLKLALLPSTRNVCFCQDSLWQDSSMSQFYRVSHYSVEICREFPDRCRVNFDPAPKVNFLGNCSCGSRQTVHPTRGLRNGKIWARVSTSLFEQQEILKIQGLRPFDFLFLSYPQGLMEPRVQARVSDFLLNS